LVAEDCRLVNRHALAATEAIYNVIQDRPDGVCDLTSGSSSAGGRPLSRAFPDTAQFFFDSA
jgi:hypothetical protein